MASEPRLIVANPGRQHSDHMALALEQAGLLAAYAHGAPVRPALAGAIDAARDWHWPRYRVGIGLLGRIPRQSLRVKWLHALYRHFGASAARRAARLDGWTVVVSAENSALPLFELAKRRAATCILDAASVHHSWQKAVTDPDMARRNRIKDAELALADHVLTCSAMARQSYVDAGVPADKVHVLRLGVDLDGFALAERGERTGPIRFLFIGRSAYAKGADVLAAACARLQQQGAAFELDCVGRLFGKAADALRPFARFHGEVGHDRLAQHLQSADVLVHPSRFDSFGLVVPEALACGASVILSDMTGAKDLLRLDASVGQVVPTGDADALAAAMLLYIEKPALARAAGDACRSVALQCDWNSYHRTAADVLRTLAIG